jgi:predicted unusual protein kinase regulating ubiquinone biosynthesis (AarF/ABC1/UbiB family)
MIGRFIHVSFVFIGLYLGFRRAVKGRNSVRLRSEGERLTRSLIDLGPTFIKVGQILSTRPDLLPHEYTEALSMLQENVPQVPFTQIRNIIEQNFKAKVEDLYLSFDQTPVASASLAQVHFAVLKDKTLVAVKIQKPGVAASIRSDLRLLGSVLGVFRILMPKTIRGLNLRDTFTEFQRYTLLELNFSLEGETLDRFRQNFSGWKNVHFPVVYWEHTNAQILTMERIAGLRLNEVKETFSSEKRLLLARDIVRMQMKMFIEDAFFHADLHPGNIFFGEDGKISVIDVGMFGEMKREQRNRFLLYWLAIAQKEKQRAFYHLLKLAQATPRADEKAYRNSYDQLLDKFYESTITEMSLTQTYLKIITMGAQFGFRFPPEMLLQAKALTTAENLAFVLAPNLRFSEEARPIVIDYMADEMSETAVAIRLEQSFPEWLLMGEILPSEISDNIKSRDDFWSLIGKSFAQKADLRESHFKEVRHGEFTIEIHESLEKVFNFITRLARYPDWHPTYTPASKVIHVSGRYIFLKPEGVGSVFRLDEIINGQHLLSNAEITEFERDKMMKWRAPFSILPFIQIGTCFNFKRISDKKTEVSEYFYFSDSLFKYAFIDRTWFSPEALTHHIQEELSGAKRIIESGLYAPDDVKYLWEDVTQVVRCNNLNFARNSS